MERQKNNIQNELSCKYQHSYAPLNYVCLNKQCIQKSLICINCLKTSHKNHKNEIKSLEYFKNTTIKQLSKNSFIKNRYFYQQLKSCQNHLFHYLAKIQQIMTTIICQFKSMLNNQFQIIMQSYLPQTYQKQFKSLENSITHSKINSICYKLNVIKQNKFENKIQNIRIIQKFYQNIFNSTEQSLKQISKNIFNIKDKNNIIPTSIDEEKCSQLNKYQDHNITSIKIIKSNTNTTTTNQQTNKKQPLYITIHDDSDEEQENERQKSQRSRQKPKPKISQNTTNKKQLFQEQTKSFNNIYQQKQFINTHKFNNKQHQNNNYLKYLKQTDWKPVGQKNIIKPSFQSQKFILSCPQIPIQLQPNPLIKQKNTNKLTDKFPNKIPITKNIPKKQNEQTIIKDSISIKNILATTNKQKLIDQQKQTKPFIIINNNNNNNINIKSLSKDKKQKMEQSILPFPKRKPYQMTQQQIIQWHQKCKQMPNYTRILSHRIQNNIKKYLLYFNSTYKWHSYSQLIDKLDQKLRVEEYQRQIKKRYEQK